MSLHEGQQLASIVEAVGVMTLARTTANHDAAAQFVDSAFDDIDVVRHRHLDVRLACHRENRNARLDDGARALIGFRGERVIAASSIA